ncbi:MAG: hypothetical protein JW712_12765 [Dehalococcoidales bacterium]|nr:hypothetical protein [Dehalococcoidales bacterium]
MYSDICEECRNSKQELSLLTEDIGNTIQLNDKDKTTVLYRKLDDISKHLREKHNLVKQGHYIGTISGFGVAVGIGAGVAWDEFRYGSLVVMVVLFAVGFILDYKARKDDRVI